MIDNAALENILTNAADLSVCCEVYDADAVPGDDGFDPSDAIGAFAAIEGIEFMGVTYTQRVRRFGNIKRTVTKEANTATVEFENVSREISRFEFTNGFEGLILVIRLISREQSTSLDRSQILFVGRCEKPKSGKKDSLTVTATFIINALDVTLPRRKYGKDDAEGRLSTDPEFEGFIHVPQYGTTTYSVRKKKGFLFFKWHKTVQKTMGWSSYSDIDQNKYVPEVWGRMQIEGTHLGYADVGTFIKLRTAFCEGEIGDLVNVRSTDSNFPLDSGSYVELYGKVGTLNGPDDPAWVAPGYYSRTAHIRGQANNTAADTTDPAPDVVGVVIGRKMEFPDPDTGVWGGFETQYNAAAHIRFALTSEDYGKLDTGWIDDDSFTEAYRFNDELIFNTWITDFAFTEAG